MITIQKTMGIGSLGAVWQDVPASEIQSVLGEAAQTHGLTVDQIAVKMADGRTIWLDVRHDNKLRGFDAVAYSEVVKQREVDAAKRAESDGYFTHQ